MRLRRWCVECHRMIIRRWAVAPNPPLKLQDIQAPHKDASSIVSPSVEAATGRLIRQGELFQRLSVSKATGHRLVAARKIGPRAIRLAGVRYDLEEVLAWLQHRRPDGSLHDQQTWPAVWQSLCRQKGGGR